MSVRVPTPKDFPASATSRMDTLQVVQLVMEQWAGDRAFGQVVHPLPAAPLRAHHLSVHQRPLDRDLRRRPVPPLAAVLRAAQFGGRQRALGAQLLDHGLVRRLGQVVVPLWAVAVGAAAEGEVRPLLDGQDAGRVGPVLEGAATGPVGVLDGRAPDGAQPGVRNELVRARQDGDGVQLHRAEMAQHPAHPAPPVGRAQKPLGAQRRPAGLVGGEFDGWGRHRSHAPNDRPRH